MTAYPGCQTCPRHLNHSVDVGPHETLARLLTDWRVCIAPSFSGDVNVLFLVLRVPANCSPRSTNARGQAQNMPETQNMQGKIVLITGTASGMGRIAAKAIAGQGARLIMVDNDVPNGEDARAEIIRDTGNSHLEFIDCDVSDFAQLRSLATQVNENYSRLDVLINNAGITETVRRESADGFELTMATNFLGPFLLSQLLLEKLKASAPSRLINICSDGHKMIKNLDWDDIDNREGWQGVNHNKGFQAYARSKLAMAAGSFRLAERLKGTGVDVHTVSPGYFLRTNIHRNMRGLWKLGVRLFWPLLQSAHRGAKNHIHLATDPGVVGDTGHYWEHQQHKAPSPASLDPDLQTRVWDYAIKATGANPSR